MVLRAPSKIKEHNCKHLFWLEWVAVGTVQRVNKSIIFSNPSLVNKLKWIQCSPQRGHCHMSIVSLSWQYFLLMKPNNKFSGCGFSCQLQRVLSISGSPGSKSPSVAERTFWCFVILPHHLNQVLGVLLYTYGYHYRRVPISLIIDA